MRIFGATLAKRIMKRKSKAGESIKFITLSELPSDMHWAIPSDHIATAYAGITHLIEKPGKQFLLDAVRQVVKQRFLK